MKLGSQFMLFIFLQTIGTLSWADELGRLFFTPQQRAQLEQAQSGNGVTRHEVMVNGIVQKHGGNRTVWIDGVAQPAGRSDEQSPESFSVKALGQHQPLTVKVGQKILLHPSPKSAP